MTTRHPPLNKLGFYQQINIFSIDVVLGGIAGGIMANKIFNTSPPAVWWFLLAAAIWIIYTLDHLSDGFKTREKSNSARHYYHYKYAKTIFLMVIILSLTGGITALLFLDWKIIYFGIILGLIAIAYLLAVRLFGHKKYLILQKEIFIAFIYTAGIWGSPVIMAGSSLISFKGIIILIFFLLALVDLLVLSNIEIESDKADNHTSLTINIGIVNATKITYGLIIFVILTSVIMIFSIDQSNAIFSGIIFIIMALSLFLIQYFKEKLRKNNVYRYLCEMVFYLPAAIVLLPG